MLLALAIIPTRCATTPSIEPPTMIGFPVTKESVIHPTANTKMLAKLSQTLMILQFIRNDLSGASNADFITGLWKKHLARLWQIFLSWGENSRRELKPFKFLLIELIHSRKMNAVLILYSTFLFFVLFTFSSHTEYVKSMYCNRMSEKKKILSFWWMTIFCMS